MSLTTRTTEFLRTHELLKRHAHLLVAVSGGCDSTVLAHVMAGLKRQWGLRLGFVYVHHGLRKEADAEATFVAELARDCGADAYAPHIDVTGVMEREGGSLQEVARRLRYVALESLRAEHGAAVILTAHHADDQAETVLAHFLRGSGVTGLAGISPLRDRIARPFLSVTREEIEAYADERGLSWMHDSSNDKDAYTRNALRHHVVPAIRAHAGGSWPRVLNDTARLFRSLDHFLAHHVEQQAKSCIKEHAHGVSLAVQTLKGYFEYEQLALLRHALERVRGSAGLFDEVFSLLHLIDAAPGKRAILRGGFIAFREKAAIVIMAPEEQQTAELVSPGQYLRTAHATFSLMRCTAAEVHFTSDPEEEFIDLRRTGEQLTLRPWTDDDEFAPFGFEGTKRVAAFLADQGLPLQRRKRIPVLAGQNGIVWVCGVRLDAHARVSDGTEDPARIRYINCEEAS